MNTILHKAETRGRADHGWLKSRHTFSFAGYYNPDRVHFGALRVLNDDIVAAAKGFGTHPHANMEIIRIPLKGALEHADSMGNKGVIREGEIQVMSAGTGIQHSEYNHSKNGEVAFLQILVFPEKENVTPRYDQIQTQPAERLNKLQQIVSPNARDNGTWVHQNTWFYLTDLEKNKSIDYALKMPEQNGVYIFVIAGEAETAGHQLQKRDGLGVWNTNSLTFKSLTHSKLLIMEVPEVM